MTKIKNVKIEVNLSSTGLISMTDKESIKPFLKQTSYYKEANTLLNNNNIVVSASVFEIDTDGETVIRKPFITKNAFKNAVFTGKYYIPICHVTPPTAEKEMTEFLSKYATTIQKHLYGYMKAGAKGDNEKGKSYTRSAAVEVSHFHLVNDVIITAGQQSQNLIERTSDSFFYKETTSGNVCKWKGDINFNLDNLRYISREEEGDVALPSKCFDKENNPIFFGGLEHLASFRDNKGGYELTTVSHEDNEYVYGNDIQIKVIRFDDQAMSNMIIKFINAILLLRQTQNGEVLTTDSITVTLTTEDGVVENYEFSKDNVDEVTNVFSGKEYVTHYRKV